MSPDFLPTFNICLGSESKQSPRLQTLLLSLNFTNNIFHCLMVSKLLISYVAITNLSELPLTKCLDKVHHKAKVFHKITQKNAETLYEA